MKSAADKRAEHMQRVVYFLYLDARAWRDFPEPGRPNHAVYAQEKAAYVSRNAREYVALERATSGIGELS